MASYTYGTTCCTIFTLCCCLIAGVYSAKPSLTTQTSQINQGNEFELRCEAAGPLRTGHNENIHFTKRQTSEGKPITISISSVRRDASYMERIEIIAIPDDNGFVMGYLLKVTGASLQDSGQFGCGIGNGDQIAQEDIVWVDIVVRQQIQTFSLYAVTAEGVNILLEDTKEYKLTRKETLHLMCVATGSSPEATFSVWFGDDDVANQLFDKTSTVVRTTDRAPHMNLITYNTTLTSKKVVAIEQPQTISCKAGVAGMEGEKAVTIYTVFRHPPVVVCDTVVAYPEEEDVQLNCNITSNPKRINVTWSVIYPSGIESDIDGDEYSINTSYYPHNFTRTTLTISRVFDNHFSNNYYMAAANSEGLNKGIAQLLKDPNAGEVHSNSASSLAASLLLITMAAALWRAL